MADDVPEGFEPFTAPGFDTLIGPLYRRLDPGDRVTLGIRFGVQHCNMRGTPHGGLLATLADIGLSFALARKIKDRSVGFVTVNLTLNYVSTAQQGEWAELCAEIQKFRGQVMFASGTIACDDRPMVLASGIFKRLPTPRET